MGHRALVLKAPYGSAFMQNHDGSLWLVYDDTAKGTSDVDILNWLRSTAMEHSEYVERNLVAENRNRPVIQVESPQSKGIAAKVLEELKKPIEVSYAREEPVRQHDWGNRYRVGGTCKVCGTKATGLEEKACSGIMQAPEPTLPPLPHPMAAVMQPPTHKPLPVDPVQPIPQSDPAPADKAALPPKAPLEPQAAPYPIAHQNQEE